MKKILLGLLTAGAVGGVAMFATGAFFSDTETSTGNTFQAGALDLKISDTCHYYKDGVDTLCPDEQLPNGGPLLTSNWAATDLNAVHKFFNFKDIKPGDYGENTIDFTVIDNPAWMCAQFTATELENNIIDPEVEAEDATETGELGKYLSFFWWVDDGDNVYETGEKILYGGPRTLVEWLALAGGGPTLPLTFADSYLNWTTWPAAQPNTLPVPGNTPQYLGVGWCFGTLVATGTGPTGFTCDGTGSQNDSQSDSITVDLTFTAEQHRNNPTFLCPENVGRPIAL